MRWSEWSLKKIGILGLLELGTLPLQCMLQIRGFLMYVVRTYMWMNPYLKLEGMQLTINSWRGGRSADDFKRSAKERRQARVLGAIAGEWMCRGTEEEEEGQDAGVYLGLVEANALETVKPVPRYQRNLECLRELTVTAEPP